MSESFICRRGGVGTPFAVIGVTYPEGSTCTCTDGTKTLTAKGTSGRAIFNIPYAATWTVKATNGIKTKSKSFQITSEWQTETVELEYNLLLYDNGAEEADLLLAYIGNYGANAPSKKDTYIYIDNSTSSGYNNYFVGTLKTNEAIPLANFSKLCCTWSDNVDYTPIVGWNSTEIGTPTWTNVDSSAYESFATGDYTKTSGTLELDISDISSSKYLGVSFMVRAADKKKSVRLLKFWLE